MMDNLNSTYERAYENEITDTGSSISLDSNYNSNLSLDSNYNYNSNIEQEGNVDSFALHYYLLLSLLSLVVTE